MILVFRICFFFNDTATTEIYTLSLHDALPIFRADLPADRVLPAGHRQPRGLLRGRLRRTGRAAHPPRGRRGGQHPTGAFVTELARLGLSRAPRGTGDRKSVVEGKSVDLGGRRIIKKKKQK